MTNQSLGWLRRHYSHRRFTLALLLALLATAALRGWLPFIYTPSYTPQTMTTLPTQHTTHCIGRYLIDLPSNFNLSTGGWGDIELYYGLDKNFQRVYATVSPGRYTNDEFWQVVNKRRFELQDKINAATKGPMLLHGEQINSSTAMLRYLGDAFYGLSIKTEVHVLVGNRYVTLEQESYSKDDNDITYTKADPVPAETRLKMIASKLMHYENAARAKPGFCMQGVLFDVGQDDETATFNFDADDVPDAPGGGDVMIKPIRKFCLPTRRSLLVLIAPLFATALLSACLPFAHASSYTPPTMTTLPTQRTTHCIGRYLIDVPANFELSTGGWGDIELYYGLDKNFKRVYATVKPGRYTNDEFWLEVNKRRFELQDEINTKTKGPMLLLGEQLNTTTALLRRLGDKFYGLSIKTEVHVLVGNRYVTLEQKSYSKDDNDITYTKADPASAETRLKMIASKLMHYENAARAKPGFCMQGVLFDVGQDDETAAFNFGSSSISL